MPYHEWDPRKNKFGNNMQAMCLEKGSPSFRDLRYSFCHTKVRVTDGFGI